MHQSGCVGAARASSLREVLEEGKGFNKRHLTLVPCNPHGEGGGGGGVLIYAVKRTMETEAERKVFCWFEPSLTPTIRVSLHTPGTF